MINYFEIYIIALTAVSLILSYVVFKSKYLKSTILAISLFIQRYGIYIEKLVRSIQISLIIIPVYTLTIIIEIIGRVPKKQRTPLTIIKKTVKEYKSSSFLKWITILIIADSVSLLWADSLVLGLIGIATRILMFLCAFNTYIALKISQEHLNFYLVGISIGVLLNTIVAILQRIDCIKNSCTTFFHIEHDILNIRGLTLTEQGIWLGQIFFPRTIGLFGDVNMHSFFINASIIAIIGGLLHLVFSSRKPVKSKIKIAIPLTLLIICGLVTSITSISRSAIMGIIIPVIYILIFFVTSEALKRKSLKPVLITLIIFSLFTLTTLLIYNKISQNLAVREQINLFINSKLNVGEDGSAQEHFRLFNEALNIGYKTTAGKGTGIGNYHSYYNKYINKDALNTDPHSWVALLYAEQGWIGTIVYVLFFIYYIFWAIVTSIRNLRKTNYLALCLKFIPMTFIIGMIFYYGFFTPMVWFWFGIAMFYIELEKTQYKLSLNSITVYVLTALITIYQKLFSFDHAFWAQPDKFRICIFQPSCSEYMKQSLQKKGVIKGLFHGAWRIVRCNPFSEGGFDPA